MELKQLGLMEIHLWVGRHHQKSCDLWLQCLWIPAVSIIGPSKAKVLTSVPTVRGFAIKWDMKLWSRWRGSCVSYWSTCTKQMRVFQNQIESEEVADQGWTDMGMPKKRWLPEMDISLERSTGTFSWIYDSLQWSMGMGWP